MGKDASQPGPAPPWGPVATGQTPDPVEAANRLGDALWDIVLDWPELARHTVAVGLLRSVDHLGARLHVDVEANVSVDRAIVRHYLRAAYRRELLAPIQVSHIKTLLTRLEGALPGEPCREPLSNKIT